jgi:site-specific DNA recombinase
MAEQQFTKEEMGVSPSTHVRALSTSTKCVAYIRVSTGKQDCSMEMQEERIKQYFREPAVSAAKIKLDKRPEGSKIAVCIAAGARHIVSLKLDRLFRNAVDALTHVEEWARDGVHFHLVDLGGQSVNTSTPMGMMLLTMLAGFAAFERDLIAERTSAALRHKKADGEVYNHPPYGYSAENGHLVLKGAEQAVIVRMERLRGLGLSYNEIADTLNQDSVPTERGGSWAAQTVLNILSR